MAVTVAIYGLKSCDTCKKAIKALEGAGRVIRFVDIRAEADLPTLLPLWLAAVGAEALINTRSTTWRGLSKADKARATITPAALLEHHPTLIKRPVIEVDGAVHIGWTAAVQSALL